METETEFKEQLAPIQSEGIKLTRGMKGTYGWEIKTLDLDIEKLKAKNERMMEEFGNDL